MKRWPALLAGAVVCASPRAADALLLVGKGKPIASDATSVVIVRDGTETVLSIQARTQEKDGEIAIVVPVPAALDTKTLVRGAFASLVEVSGPRVAEYWEADPCDAHPMVAPPISSDSASAPSAPPSASSTQTPPSPSDQTGEYKIEILDAKDAATTLKGEGFTLSSDDEPALASYAGAKIVVAKIDAAKLTNGLLPPLLVHFQGADLVVPTRLWAAGGGVRALDVYVLAPGKRFEAKSQPNLAIFTNLDVQSSVRPSLGAFYGALVDKAFDKKPGAVLTEYAWRASTCDLCKAPLSTTSVGALGLGLLPSAKDGSQSEVIVNADAVSSAPGGPEDLRKKLDGCYAKALGDKPGLGGSVKLAIEVADGKVTSAKPTADKDGAPDEALARCATDATMGAPLEKNGSMTIGFSPMSRKYFNDLVLTKLRVHYDKAPDADLVLKDARAIEGGREEGPQGKPEKKVYWAQSTNDFQPRYVIRHAFKGKIKCDTPERGVWVASNPDAKDASKGEGDPKKLPADIATVIEGGLPDPESFVIAASDAPPLVAPPVPSAVAADPVAAPSASAAPSSQPISKPEAGCGACATAPASETDAAWMSVAVTGLLLTVARGRLRTKRQSR